MDAIQAYRESEVAGDNPVHLVVLLYGQLLRDIRRALDALSRNDIPARCQELDHALMVLSQLQHTLNLENGGEVAETLDNFYNLVRRNLVLAGTHQSPDLLESQHRQILAVREAWIQVERQQTPAPAGLPQDPEDEGGGKWKA